MNVYVYVYVYVCVCLCMCMCVYVYLYMYVGLCVCVCVPVHSEAFMFWEICISDHSSCNFIIIFAVITICSSKHCSILLRMHSLRP